VGTLISNTASVGPITGDPTPNDNSVRFLSEVIPAHTSTTVSSSLNSSVYGQSVTFTATVRNLYGSFTPTGSVQFVIDGSNYGSAVFLSASGTASISDNALTVTGSPHTIAAVYSNSDGDFAGSTSNTISQTVQADPTFTTLTSSLNSSVSV
jgi:hypothetical protein